MPFGKSFSVRKLLGGIALGSALAVPGTALAHGGIPRAYGIVFEPGNPDHIVLRSIIWGIFRSMDGGKTWNYGCAELYGAKWSQATYASVVVAPGGRILVPNQNFLNGKPVGLGMTDDLCNWRAAPDVAGKFVQEVVPNGSDLYLVTADGQNGGILGQIYKSTDKGDSWKPQGVALPTDFSGSSIAIAPSNASRLYALGEIINTGGGSALLETSSDGGATWTRGAGRITKELPDGAPDPGWTPRIYGVHPTRPDVVFAWADGYEGLGVSTLDEVWASGDAGKTWKKIYVGKGDLPGFTFSQPDASKILIAGPNDGIQEASVDDALANGQAAFTKIFDDQVWGLNWTPDGLFAGNNDFTLNGTPPPFTFGVSKDEGHSFSKIMTLCDVTFATCDANSTMGNACSTSWSDPSGGYTQDYIEGPRCAAPTAKNDGGTPAAAPPSDSGGCSLTAPRTPLGSAGLGALLVSTMLGFLRRKRRQSR